MSIQEKSTLSSTGACDPTKDRKEDLELSPTAVGPAMVVDGDLRSCNAARKIWWVKVE